MTVLPIIVGSLGTTPKNLIFEEFEVKRKVGAIQATAFLH